MEKKYNNVMANDYNEANALQRLLETAVSSCERDNERFELDRKDAGIERFSIIVDGEQIEFIMGGPQLDALFAFVDHIANENGYEVDYKLLTVKE